MGSIYVICSRQCPNGDGIYTLLNALYKYSTSITNQPTCSGSVAVATDHKTLQAAAWKWPGVGLSYELYGQGIKCRENVKIVATALVGNAVVLKSRGLECQPWFNMAVILHFH